MVNSMGILTFETVPGLNRHFRNALSADLSKVESPVLCSIETPVTRPLAWSTDTTQTPLPVTPSERTLSGYLGRGAKVARAFAEENEIVAALASTSGALAGDVFRRFGCCGGGVVSSTGSGLISGGGGEIDCFLGVDAAVGFSEVFAAPISSIRFCNEAISFCFSSNLVC